LLSTKRIVDSRNINQIERVVQMTPDIDEITDLFHFLRRKRSLLCRPIPEIRIAIRS